MKNSAEQFAFQACIFYHYYKGSKPDAESRSGDEDVEEEGPEQVEHQPSQCFLYDGCSRSVLPATSDCPLTKWVSFFSRNPKTSLLILLYVFTCFYYVDYSMQLFNRVICKFESLSEVCNLLQLNIFEKTLLKQLQHI